MNNFDDDKNKDLNEKSEYFNIGDITEESLELRLKSSFLNYSMSVICNRALPDIRDGLKPIHRRIIFTMREIKLFPNTPFKKSAKVVGEVIAKYHPHGDASVYGTLVRMAQDFSYRYPFVIPQGNFGSIDGDSPAAMRYTEVKMSHYALSLTQDIEYDTIDFKPNYDNSEKEPVVLPSRLPNLLLNGSDGIAVGMATSIPPHNLGEIIDCIFYIIDNKDATVDDLLVYVKGPDFPTGAYIQDSEKLKEIYRVGRGSVVIRSKHHIEGKDTDKTKKIVITEIPYFVNKSVLVNKIAEYIQMDSVLKVKNIRDESNRFGIRIVIEIGADKNENLIINKLYRHTQLQTNYHCKFLALINQKPYENLDLKTILVHYIKHQYIVLKRRTNFFLKKDLHKENICKGILIAIANTEVIIKVIKESDTTDKAINALYEKFQLNKIQAKAVLDMRLQRLTSIQVNNLNNDIEVLQKNIAINQNILSADKNIYELIKKELQVLKDKYNIERRTKLIPFNQQIFDHEIANPNEIIITLSKNNMIKSTLASNFRIQNRSGFGIKSANLYDNDYILLTVKCNSIDSLLFFTNRGRVFSCKAFQIPEESRTSKGTAIINILPSISKRDEKIVKILPKAITNDNDYLVFLTYKGKVKKIAIDQVANVNKSGKVVINIEKYQDHIVDITYGNDDSKLMISADSGKNAFFSLNSIRKSGRNSYGVGGIKTVNQNPTNLMSIDDLSCNILFVSKKGYGKISNASIFRVSNRNVQGNIGMKINEKTGKLFFINFVKENDNVVLTTNTARTIIIPVNQISIHKGRSTAGTRLLRLKPGEIVSAVNIFSDSIENNE